MSSVTLNYVWINAVRQWRGIWPYVRAAECPIPQRYLEQVSNVRAENPEIDINIWFDVFKRGYAKGRLSQEFGAAAGLQGVQFRQLREIPSYHSNDLFGNSHFINRENSAERDNKIFCGSIWRQVDLARLLVIQHQMNTTGGIQVYADLDVLSPVPSAIQNINRYGFNFASNLAGFKGEENRFHMMENHHFAFDSDHAYAQDLIGRLVLNTAYAYDVARITPSNGWGVFVKTVSDFKERFYRDVPVSELMIFSDTLSPDHSAYPGYAP